MYTVLVCPCPVWFSACPVCERDRQPAWPLKHELIGQTVKPDPHVHAGCSRKRAKILQKFIHKKCIYEWVFQATILHCKAILGRGKNELMRWILEWIMPQMSDLSSWGSVWSGKKIKISRLSIYPVNWYFRLLGTCRYIEIVSLYQQAWRSHYTFTAKWTGVHYVFMYMHR